MKRTSSERPATRGRPLELPCPECTQYVAVASDELVEGSIVHCAHCGCEAELTEEYDDFAGKGHWVLVDPLADFDDEADRRG